MGIGGWEGVKIAFVVSLPFLLCFILVFLLVFLLVLILVFVFAFMSGWPRNVLHG